MVKLRVDIHLTIWLLVSRINQDTHDVKPVSRRWIWGHHRLNGRQLFTVFKGKHYHYVRLGKKGIVFHARIVFQ